MIVIKHDEAENARAFDLDREAWVMLVGFLEDLRNAAVKVYLNDDAKIPDSVNNDALARFQQPGEGGCQGLPERRCQNPRLSEG